MSLDLVVNCPSCGQHLRTHGIGDAPQLKQHVALARLKKAAARTDSAVAQRTVRRAELAVTREDLPPETDAFLRGWGRRMLGAGGSETVRCACGGVVRYELDTTKPFGVRLVDVTAGPKDARIPTEDSP